jgi:Flp pilus assembly protein TadB
MRNGVIVAAAVVTTAGLLAIAAALLLRQASERSAKRTRDLQRWEDDGGNPPAHAPSGHHSA